VLHDALQVRALLAAAAAAARCSARMCAQPQTLRRAPCAHSSLLWRGGHARPALARRYNVLLQVPAAVRAISACLQPTLKLLGMHEKLSQDAQYLCSMASWGMEMVTGFDSMAPSTQGLGCSGGLAFSKAVMLVILISAMAVPLLITYAVESAAKLNWLARLQAQRQGRPVRVRQPWMLWLTAALVSLLLCDVAVDLVHWVQARLGAWP
jgi:hypothetical protein